MSLWCQKLMLKMSLIGIVINCATKNKIVIFITTQWDQRSWLTSVYLKLSASFWLNDMKWAEMSAIVPHLIYSITD